MSRTMKLRILTALVPLALSCGGGSGSSIDGGSGSDAKRGSSTCKITLSGALSGTYNCFSDPVATWISAPNITSVAFTSDGTPQKGSVTIIITASFIGAPAAGLTCTGSDANIYAWAFGVTEIATMKTWSAGSPDTLNPPGGSYALTISDPGTVVELDGGRSYLIHGSLHATAVPDTSSGAAGGITADVTF